MKPTIDHMPRETQREREHYSAPNSCSLCCICAACEAQKLSVTKRVAFFCQRDKDGEDRWWLEVFGKGDNRGMNPWRRVVICTPRTTNAIARPRKT